MQAPKDGKTNSLSKYTVHCTSILCLTSIITEKGTIYVSTELQSIAYHEELMKNIK